MHTLLDVLHVVGAVFLVGPMAILPMTGMRAMRSGDGGQVATLARSTNVFSLLSLLVVVFGFGVLGTTEEKYDLSFATPWIWVSLLLYAVALALSLAVVVPALRGAGARLEGEGGSTGDAAAKKAYGRVASSSGVVALLLLAVVVLMVAKP